jgi:hypothetical protein
MQDNSQRGSGYQRKEFDQNPGMGHAMWTLFAIAAAVLVLAALVVVGFAHYLPTTD